MALRAARVIHQHRGNRLQTAPAAEPVTLDEVKTHLRITGTDDDTYLTGLIAEARQEIEDATGIALISQEWLLSLDRWPAAREAWWDGEREGHIDMIYGGRENYGSVTLPRYPLQTVDTVTVYDEDGNSTAVAIASVFDIDTQRLRGRLTLQRGATWPIALRSNNAIEIAYSAGYGDAAAAVPAPLKRAVRQMVAYMFEHRGDGCEPKDAFTASGAKSILDRYRDVEV
jgi:uncharacterized phiE125 gp8 family phage protein